MSREMDGICIRIQRNGKWENVCLSDMSIEERTKALEDKSAEFLIGCINHLAERLREVGDIMADN